MIRQLGDASARPLALSLGTLCALALVILVIEPGRDDPPDPNDAVARARGDEVVAPAA